METQQEAGSAPETTTTPTEAAPQAASAQGAQETTSSNTGEATQGGEPAWSPNFKFKVMDEEKEIDEWLRGAIKDPDTEKKARELYEKAFGLDHVKPKYEATKKSLEEMQSKWSPIDQDLKVLASYLKPDQNGQKDLASFFKTFNLTDEDVLSYSLNRVEYYQLPPEKQKQIDSQNARNQQLAQLQLENQNLKATTDKTQVERELANLNSHLASPHISPLAEAYNAKAGQPQAFMQAVIAHAQIQSSLQQRELSIPEAVESFVKTFGLQPPAASGAGQTGVAETTQPAARQATLPKSGSGSQSPVKTKVKSMADLRKLQESAFSTGHG